MLSNKDFSNIFSTNAKNDRNSGGNNNNNNGEKVRFDLKQIKKWDQENKQKETKGKNKKYEEEEEGGERERNYQNIFNRNNNSDGISGYRDRAKERREEEMNNNPSSSSSSISSMTNLTTISSSKNNEFNNNQIEVILSKLSAEETRYLGGDIDHTHLVKGLDYSLLNKIRNETKSESNHSNNNNNNSNIHNNVGIVIEKENQKLSEKKSRNETIDNITTMTYLGTQIKKFFISESLKTSSSIQIKPIISKKDSLLVINQTIPIIARTSYEYDLKLSSENYLPTILLRSKDETLSRFETNNGSNSNQVCIPYKLPPSLFTNLKELFQLSDEGIKQKCEKKQLEHMISHQIMTSSTITPSTTTTTIIKPIIPRVIEPINIFDDEIRKYDPNESLTQSTSTTTSSLSSSLPLLSQNASNSTVKYFDSFSTFQKKPITYQNLDNPDDNDDDMNKNEDKDVEEEERSEDLMAPVKKLVAGQLLKQSILLNQKNNQEIIIEEGKKHRDLIGGLTDNKDKKDSKHSGYSMTNSSYDVYTEEVEYDENDSNADSDDEEEGSGKKKKKKSSQQRSHDQNHSQSKSSGGLNRSARRALERGESSNNDSKKRQRHD